MGPGWQLSEFLSIITMIGAAFVFLYSEIKHFKSEIKEEFKDIKNCRRAEIETYKSDILVQINDVKQTFKNDLFGHKSDLKQDMNDLKSEAKKDMKGMQQEIVYLTEKIARLEALLSFLRDDPNNRT